MSSQEFADVVNGLLQRVATLEGALALHEGERTAKKKIILKEIKAFQSLEKYDEKNFDDWGEFTLMLFVSEYEYFEKWLTWVKEQAAQITLQDMQDLQDKARGNGYVNVDVQWFDEQLFSI